MTTVKPVLRDHLQESEKVVFEYRWSLNKGHIICIAVNRGKFMVVSDSRGLLNAGGLSSRFDCRSFG